MESRPYDERTCIIVVLIGQSQVGLVVDTVNEVRNIDASQVSPPPKTAGAGQNRDARSPLSRSDQGPCRRCEASYQTRPFTKHKTPCASPRMCIDGKARAQGDVRLESSKVSAILKVVGR